MADFNFGANKKRPFGQAKAGSARPAAFKVTKAAKKKAAAFRTGRSGSGSGGS